MHQPSPILPAPMGGDNADDRLSRLRHTLRDSGLSQAAFARRVGIDPANMSRYLSGKQPVTGSLINRVAVELGVDSRWLATGEASSADPFFSEEGAPVYDIDVTAGAREHQLELTADRMMGRISLPGIDPEYPLVRVSGDSMEPEIHDGALISIRPVTVCRDIFWGHIYVVVLDDYRMVKYVHRCRRDPDTIVLRSANKRYDDIDISLHSVRRLFLVQDILNINHRY